MYIGEDPFYWAGILTGIRNMAWGNLIAFKLVFEGNQIRYRPYVSEVKIEYIKRK